VSDSGSAVVQLNPPDHPRIEAFYPNPVAEGDAGEFVTVSLPGATDPAEWTLTDGESTVSLANASAVGSPNDSVTFASEPAAATNHTNDPVVAFNDTLSLANGGDELTLRHGSETVDETSYENAPDAELRRRTTNESGGGDGVGWEWTPLGATDFAPSTTGPTTVRAFVLPDGPGIPIEMIRSANDRVLIGAYTFESEAIARELKRAVDRGVDVRILVDDAPAGGIATAQARVLDSLVEAGITVSVTGGEYGRYDFHHPKYAVVDDRALVATENWKPSGLGGHASRGWGAVVESERTATELADVFRADSEWRDTTSWEDFRAGRTFTAEPPANESYPTAFEPRSVRAESVTLLAAPDNAESAVVSRIEGAEESLSIIQAEIGSRDQPFIRATLQAARRGVEVEVLLSSAWYSEDDNEAMVAWLREIAQRESLSLEANVADPGDRFAKIHAKGLIVDRETVVLGSLNWNNNSARENREIALAIEGSEVGAYYGQVFDADWQGGRTDTGSEWLTTTDLPVGLAVAVGGVVALVLLVARRIEFSD
jgi:phosphatidylserine/phosphatidylglycerophosphate/cardiolipin synthase-like enzyme